MCLHLQNSTLHNVVSCYAVVIIIYNIYIIIIYIYISTVSTYENQTINCGK